MNLLVLFIILTIVNVIGSTIRSLVVIKGGKWSSSFVSALYYGYYNIVLIYTVADFPLWQKVIVTFGCNVIGVWLVKFFEEKGRKDKLWKIECTIRKSEAEMLKEDCERLDLSCSWVDINKYYLFNFYCPTQKDSAMVKELLSKYSTVKYFVSESKNLQLTKGKVCGNIIIEVITDQQKRGAMYKVYFDNGNESLFESDDFWVLIHHLEERKDYYSNITRIERL